MRQADYEREIVARLDAAVGQRLVSVVVYGPTAHDDTYPAIGGEHLLIVVADLSIETLKRLAEPVRWWLKKRQPWPRLFSSDLLASSTDVYPIEMLALSQHRRIIFGSDPLSDLHIDRVNLRTQCERELREKLMRLREGYIEGDLHALLSLSYASFVQIFRGCLYLLDTASADRDPDVVMALCDRLDLSPDAFAAVDRIARGQRSNDLEAVFAAYYRDLTAVAERIDRLVINTHRSAP